MNQTHTNNKLPKDFSEFVSTLNANNVEYLIIGGYAMGVYGHIRATADLDIFINATEQNAQRVLSACKDFDIPEHELSKEMFMVPKMVGVGAPPFRIKLLKNLGKIDFKCAYQRAKKIYFDGLPISVISFEDLILLKKTVINERRESKDEKDLQFLENLKSKSSGKHS